MMATSVPIAFSRSLRSIEADGYRRAGVAFAIAFALAAGWTAWFLLAEIAVIEVAETARLEVDQAAHTLAAPVAGTVITTRLELGRQVAAGDVLVELDGEPLRLSRDAERAKLAAFEPQLAALALELAAEERALEEHGHASASQIEEADAHRREAEAAAGFADDEMRRTARLRGEGLASEADALRATAEAEQRRAAASGARLAMTRIASELRAVETERRAKLARVRRELAELAGAKAISVATVAQLEHELERRRIRAPVAGRLGEIAPLQVGSVVDSGTRLGAIVPAGDLRIVAEYLPVAAVGRIREGQRARMRLDGFPWTEYGALAATVRSVGSEPRSGRIRVELAVDLPASSSIPVQHGLPGTLEVEVEHATPAALVLRAAGRRLAAPVRESTRSDRGEGNPPPPADP
jgi:membrane fusion protein (multidrug efflux system)